MKRFQVGVAALAVMLSAACGGASGSTGTLLPHGSAPTIAGTLSSSDRSVTSAGRALQATDIHPGGAAAARTRVVSVRPVNAAHKLAAGYRVRHTFVTSRGGPPGGCWPGSTVASAAYRCFTTNNLVVDPCWVDGAARSRSVLCLGAPWSTNVVRLRLSGQLDPLPPPRQAVEPWGLRLSNGWGCLAGQGTHDQFNGRVVFYNCDGWRSGRVVLLGINRSQPLWRAQTATRSTRGVYRTGPSVAVLSAWYAKP